MVLQDAWLKKIRDEAIMDGRIPALGIEIGKKEYYVVEAIYFGGSIL